ncbi:MAG: FHA domain-containing protein [Kiloniellales bacterium]|nr:FHA domain-containing protein [Kiloniellales bacterium]
MAVPAPDPFRDPSGELEDGWRFEGHDGVGRPVRILVGETELARTYLGVTIGRHPLLCHRVIEDSSVSRRHFRLGRSAGGIFIEDVNSLNGTYLDGEALGPFDPVLLHDGQILTLGRVVLTAARLGPAGAG